MARLTRKERQSMAAAITSAWLASGRPYVPELSTVPPCKCCGRIPPRGYHRLGEDVQCLSPDSECMRFSDLRRINAGTLPDARASATPEQGGTL